MIALTGYRVLDRIIAMKKVIDPVEQRLVISERCPQLFERLMNYKWPQTAEGQNKETPEHDWASHGADSAGYGVLYYLRHRRILRKPVLGGEKRGMPRGIVTSGVRVGRG